jgi:hypothetical protein
VFARRSRQDDYSLESQSVKFSRHSGREGGGGAMSNLEEHAERELRRAGLFDKDADYGGMLAPAIMKLIHIFAEEGHSGTSAVWSLQLFTRLASFKALTPLTTDPSEWSDVSDSEGGKPLWQNIRQSSCFSEDEGKHYWDIDEKGRPLHTSKPPPAGGKK